MLVHALLVVHAPQGILASFAKQGVARVLKKFFVRASDAQPAAFTFFMPEQMSYSTMCSGTEIPSISVNTMTESINSQLEELGVSVTVSKESHEGAHKIPQMIQTFLCEIDDDKRSFAQTVAAAIDTTPDGPCCSFKDARGLCREKAQCFTHGRLCPIAWADGEPSFVWAVRNVIESHS